VSKPLPFAGISVVDLTCDVGELCGRILAELGAHVVRVEPPGGSTSRSRDNGIWWAYRNANKHGLVLDLDDADDRARLDVILAGVDVVLESPEPTSPALDPAALSARHPHLVVCALTWFGLHGPYSRYVATDDVVVAMSGLLSSSGASSQPPVSMPGSLASDVISVMGAVATALALEQRRSTGRGQVLDVSALEAVAQIDSWAMPNASAIVNAGGQARRVRAGEKGLYPALRVTDGWARLVLMAPRQWWSLFEWMGSPEAFADPYWQHPFNRFANTDVLNPVLQEFYGSMSATEASVESQRRGLVVTPMLTPSQVVSDEHLRSRDTFVDVELADGAVVPMTNGLFEFDGERAGYSRNAPSLGDNEAMPSPSAPPVADARPRSRPLEGVRVLDFGHGGVGVQGGRLLAEYGADVIKVESRSYLDFMRSMSGGEMTPSFASSSRSKRSFGVDLKKSEGIALIKQLVAHADVIIENNSTGTMNALGLGYDALRAINPALVYVSSQMLGSRGTRADWSGYGPSAQAYGGLSHLWRFADSDPVPNMQNHPDLLAGYLVALGAIAGLSGRARTGVGLHCELAQVEVIVNLLGDLLIAETLAPGTVGPDGNHDSRGAPWGVFPCEGYEEWCVICVRDDREWQGLVVAMGNPGWASDGRWSLAADRLAEREELGALVADWTRSRSPAEVTAACQDQGVPAGPMRYPVELLDDPQLLHRGFPTRIEQPGAGALVVDGSSFIASGMAPPVIESAPALGEHTRSIARELLSLDDAAIDELIASGVLEVPLTHPTD
jgi:crotonobetainyl-CoA:carnitine CoA-transferase CaiB-like acyl-CoA transferase